MENLRRLERRPAREVWLNEAAQFTPWLAENLDVLGAELGLALTLRSREHAVGRYWLDLLLEDARGRTIVVENQFEKADHDHLGKLLTYASGTEADVVVWIAESFGDEHIAALEWLNDKIVPGVGFFAVQLELLQIGNERAPHFQVLVRPNEWVQEARQRSAERMEWDWDRYAADLAIPDERLQIGRALVDGLERAVADRDLPWQLQFRKGYVALQRAGGYNVAIVDVYYRNAPRFSVKLPDAPEALGLTNPYPNLPAKWTAADREWDWTVSAVDRIPDIGVALELSRRYQPESGPMASEVI